MVGPRAAAHDPVDIASSIERLSCGIRRVVRISKVGRLKALAPETTRPLPDVARHIQASVWTGTIQKDTDRRRPVESRLPDIALQRIEDVSPWIVTRVLGAPCRLLPLCLARQCDRLPCRLGKPTAIGQGILKSDSGDRVRPSVPRRTPAIPIAGRLMA